VNDSKRGLKLFFWESAEKESFKGPVAGLAHRFVERIMVLII